MNRLFIPTLLLTSFLIAACQHKPVERQPETDWQRLELQGPVSKILEITVAQDTSQLEMMFSPDGMLTDQIYYHNGQIVRHTFYTDSMRWQISNTNELEWLVNIQKNEKGLVTETWSQSALGEIVTTYTYDSEDRLVTEDNYGDADQLTSSVFYEYDSKGRLIKETTVDPEGRIEMLVLYTYNRKNQNTVVEQYDGSNRLLQRQERTYDRAGHTIGEKYTNADGVIIYNLHSTYRNGMLVEKHCTGANIYDQHYVYLYQDDILKIVNIEESEDGKVVLRTNRLCDDYGNWIVEQEQQLAEYGELDSSNNSNSFRTTSNTYREITYFQ